MLGFENACDSYYDQDERKKQYGRIKGREEVENLTQKAIHLESSWELIVEAFPGDWGRFALVRHDFCCSGHTSVLEDVLFPGAWWWGNRR